MLTHIIFDFDGVIVNSDSFHLWVIREVLTSKNLPFDGEIYKSYFQGRRLVEAFTIYLQSFNKLDQLIECIEQKRSYDAHYADNVTLYKDTLSFLAEAKRTHVLSIVTSTRRVLLDAALAKFHLAYSFQVTVAAEDCVRGKPDPDPYITAMRLLKTMPHSILVIEDSPIGIVAAKAAHMKCLALTHTHPPEELKDADWVSHTLATVDLAAISKLGEEQRIESEDD